MSQTTKSCLLCGRSGEKLTREHVLPKHWKQRFPQIQGGNSFRRAGFSLDNDVRGNSFFEQTVKGICEDCNHNWLHDIDLDASDLIGRLVLGEQTELTSGDVEVLEVWMTKTCLIRSLVDKSQSMDANPQLLKQFRATRLPLNEASTQVGRVSVDDGFWIQVSNTAPGGRVIFDYSDGSSDHVDIGALWNIMSFTFGHIFIQTGVVDPANAPAVSSLRQAMNAVRDRWPGRIIPLRSGPLPNSRLDEHDTKRASEPMGVLGLRPFVFTPDYLARYGLQL